MLCTQTQETQMNSLYQVIRGEVKISYKYKNSLRLTVRSSKVNRTLVSTDWPGCFSKARFENVLLTALKHLSSQVSQV